MRVFIDNFSGSVGDLKPKQKGNVMIVLSFLAKDPNVSTWDMGTTEKYALWKTIKKLEKLNYIKSIPTGYPWHKFELTEEGQKALNEYNNC